MRISHEFNIIHLSKNVLKFSHQIHIFVVIFFSAIITFFLSLCVPVCQIDVSFFLCFHGEYGVFYFFSLFRRTQQFRIVCCICLNYSRHIFIHVWLVTACESHYILSLSSFQFFFYCRYCCVCAFWIYFHSFSQFCRIRANAYTRIYFFLLLILFLCVLDFLLHGIAHENH